MTDRLFFDTDCISSFMWSDEGCLLTQLYPGRIIIPEMVHQELSRVRQPQFVKRINSLLDSGEATLMDIEVGSPSFSLYRRMTTNPEPGHSAIGKGEASALALAHEHNGIIASNNFRDIRQYVHDLKLNYLSTGDIMVEAYEQGLISLDKANDIWRIMVQEDCWIGADSFNDFLNKPYKPLLNGPG